MTQQERISRFGTWCGIALKELGDKSYIDRWLKRPSKLTQADYVRETNEIMRRLAAAGKLDVEEPL